MDINYLGKNIVIILAAIYLVLALYEICSIAYLILLFSANKKLESKRKIADLINIMKQGVGYVSINDAVTYILPPLFSSYYLVRLAIWIGLLWIHFDKGLASIAIIIESSLAISRHLVKNMVVHKIVRNILPKYSISLDTRIANAISAGEERFKKVLRYFVDSFSETLDGIKANFRETSLNVAGIIENQLSEQQDLIKIEEAENRENLKNALDNIANNITKTLAKQSADFLKHTDTYNQKQVDLLKKYNSSIERKIAKLIDKVDSNLKEISYNLEKFNSQFLEDMEKVLNEFGSDLSESADSISSPIKKLKQEIENFREELSTYVSSEIENLNNISETLKLYPEKLDQFSKYVSSLSDEIQMLDHAVGSIKDSIEDFREITRSGKVVFETPVRNLQDTLTALLEKYEKQIENLNTYTEHYTSQRIAQLEKGTENISKTLGAGLSISEEIKSLSKELLERSRTIFNALEELTFLRNSFEKFATKMGTYSESVEKSNIELMSTLNAVSISLKKFDKQLARYSELIKQLVELSEKKKKGFLGGIFSNE